MSPPTLYSLNPATKQVTTVHSFPSGGGNLFGIGEYGDEVFVVVAGTNLWTVDFRESPPDIKNSVSVNEAQMLNGVTKLHDEAVLIAESGRGTVWRLETNAGNAVIAQQLPEQASPPGGFAIGVNGVRVRDGYLYWTNTNGRAFYRVQIDAETGTASEGAAVEKIAEFDVIVDDFAFDEAGNAYIATANANTVLRVAPDGSVSTLIGSISELTVAGATAAKFGRRPEDQDILYVVTNGGQTGPVNGVTEGGKVVAVNTSTDAA
ncbi:hypothetical protein AJ80_04569 [Polytolypa hystricis UAMH7299]|uniref:SMP-30/Gluconolactonase/LRE-like region domain-containing protein n=1 Tax=Polytolypa hystricis (strain UAMH7299) TaxID=1447883 RepID=A0A2B7YBD1_POLH7|nr:hypothetical protein AJ80_04569 [Polytolypa hystricis UAMH7299]